MKKTLLAVVSMAIIGCTGTTPDVDDIKPGLTQAWSECKGIKISDIQKTNLIPKGDGYKMPVSYKLELLQDFGGCPQGPMFDALYSMTINHGIKVNKGDVIPMEITYNMVKSEKGWIQQ